MLVAVAEFTNVNEFPKLSFEMPPIDITVGALALPPKSPANCIFPFTELVASTMLPVDVELDPATALFSTYFLTAY